MSVRSVLTDDKGKTIIFFPKETSSDSVMIVAGGYEPTWYLYDGKKIRDTVFLYPKKETLEEVEVTGSQLKKKIVTNSPFSCSSCGGFISTDGKRKGSEVAAKIKLSANKTFFITGLVFNMVKNTLNDTIFIRMNIYEFKEGYPKNLVYSSQMIPVTEKSCSEKKIPVPSVKTEGNAEVVISLECLSEGSGLDRFCFSTSGKNEAWVRYSGFSGWKKIRGGSLSVKVECLEEIR